MSNAKLARKARQYTISVAGYDAPFTFNVVRAQYQAFQREVQRDLGAATENFLLNTSTERERLVDLFEEHWGLPAILMEKLAEPMVELRSAQLKNSTGA